MTIGYYCLNISFLSLVHVSPHLNDLVVRLIELVAVVVFKFLLVALDKTIDTQKVTNIYAVLYGKGIAFVLVGGYNIYSYLFRMRIIRISIPSIFPLNWSLIWNVTKLAPM